MSDPIEATPQIEADKKLVQFASYEDYLDSLTTDMDICYLNFTAARTIAELGYRTTGEMLTRPQYEKRLAAVLEYLYPKVKPYVLASEHTEGTTNMQRELAIRENANRLGIMATIIFIRVHTKSGYEVSGYIDYSESLIKYDWQPFFQGLKPLLPKPGDLGYYDWKLNRYSYKDSRNYKIVIDPHHGLLFQNRYDRKYVTVDPSQHTGYNSTRIRISSENNTDTLVLYDHVVMQRV